MSAHSTYELKLFASAFMFTNLVNIVMWSLDFYLSAHLYIVLFIVFFLRQVVFLKKKRYSHYIITSLNDYINSWISYLGVGPKVHMVFSRKTNFYR
jgi:hypothetical protein